MKNGTPFASSAASKLKDRQQWIVGEAETYATFVLMSTK